MHDNVQLINTASCTHYATAGNAETMEATGSFACLRKRAGKNQAARWRNQESTTASLPYQGTSAGSLNVRTRLMLQQQGAGRGVLSQSVGMELLFWRHGRAWWLHVACSKAKPLQPSPVQASPRAVLASCQRNSPVEHAIQHHVLCPVQQRAAHSGRSARSRHGRRAVSVKL